MTFDCISASRRPTAWGSCPVTLFWPCPHLPSVGSCQGEDGGCGGGKQGWSQPCQGSRSLPQSWRMTSAASSRSPVPCGGLAHSLARPYPYLWLYRQRHSTGKNWTGEWGDPWNTQVEEKRVIERLAPGNPQPRMSLSPSETRWGKWALTDWACRGQPRLSRSVGRTGREEKVGMDIEHACMPRWPGGKEGQRRWGSKESTSEWRSQAGVWSDREHEATVFQQEWLEERFWEKWTVWWVRKEEAPWPSSFPLSTAPSCSLKHLPQGRHLSSARGSGRPSAPTSAWPMTSPWMMPRPKAEAERGPKAVAPRTLTSSSWAPQRQVCTLKGGLGHRGTSRVPPASSAPSSLSPKSLNFLPVPWPCLQTPVQIYTSWEQGQDTKETEAPSGVWGSQFPSFGFPEPSSSPTCWVPVYTPTANQLHPQAETTTSIKEKKIIYRKCTNLIQNTTLPQNVGLAWKGQESRGDGRLTTAAEPGFSSRHLTPKEKNLW